MKNGFGVLVVVASHLELVETWGMLRRDVQVGNICDID
jgi:hypothetical protein